MASWKRETITILKGDGKRKNEREEERVLATNGRVDAALDAGAPIFEDAAGPREPPLALFATDASSFAESDEPTTR